MTPDINKMTDWKVCPAYFHRQIYLKDIMYHVYVKNNAKPSCITSQFYIGRFWDSYSIESLLRDNFCWLFSIAPNTSPVSGPAEPPATEDATGALGVHI